ncbi:glucose-1-phosphate adenylyltransferase [compost metagenome]
MNVMLLAAGEGTRLRPYTLTLPKPAIPFLNVPLAAHSLSFLHGVDVDKLVVNTYHLPSKIHELFKSLPHPAKELHFSDEAGEILGSGGGLGKARSHFLGGGDFVMMNADEIILPRDSEVMKKAQAQHKKNQNIATIMVMDHPGVGTQFGGVWTDANNKVLGFGKTPLPGAVKAWHFIGVQFLSEKVFSFIPQEGPSNILYDSLVAAITQGFRVEAFPFECQWFETGNPQDFLEATQACLEILKSGQSPAKECLARTLAQYHGTSEVTSVSQADVLNNSKSLIPTSAKISGFVCLSEGAKLPASCELQNVIVGKNVVIPEGTKTQDTLILS